jgi:hypothetical protein
MRDGTATIIKTVSSSNGDRFPTLLKLTSSITRNQVPVLQVQIPLSPSREIKAAIPTHRPGRNILQRLQPAHTTNSKLCSSLRHTYNSTRARPRRHRIIWNPTRMAECIADAFCTGRHIASVTVWARPGSCGDTSHYVSTTAGLPAERGCDACAVDLAGDEAVKGCGGCPIMRGRC